MAVPRPAGPRPAVRRPRPPGRARRARPPGRPARFALRAANALVVALVPGLVLVLLLVLLAGPVAAAPSAVPAAASRAGPPAARRDGEPPRHRHLPPVAGQVVDPFRPPADRFAAGNRGVDYRVAPGTPVRASADGVVAFAGQVGGALHVTVLDDDGLRVTASFLAVVLVHAGDHVRQGDVLALTGDVVHIGVRDPTDAYLDPEAVFADTDPVRVRLVPSGDDGATPDDDPAGPERPWLLAVVAERWPALDTLTAAWRGPARVVLRAVDRARGMAGFVTSHLGRRVRVFAHTLSESQLVTHLGRVKRGLKDWLASREDCTPRDTPAPRVTDRRIVVEVAGIGSTSDVAAVDEVRTAELGIAPADVVRFSYNGGIVPRAPPSPAAPAVPAATTPPALPPGPSLPALPPGPATTVDAIEPAPDPGAPSSAGDPAPAPRPSSTTVVPAAVDRPPVPASPGAPGWPGSPGAPPPAVPVPATPAPPVPAPSDPRTPTRPRPSDVLVVPPTVRVTSYDERDSQQDLFLEGRRLRVLLDELAAANPGVPLDVVAHSQGGIVARLALEDRRADGQPPVVRHLVTLGSPHEGADLADVVVAADATPNGHVLLRELPDLTGLPLDPDLPAGPELASTSPVIELLRAHPPPDGVAVTSIAARGDLVVPAGRSFLAGASTRTTTVALAGTDAHARLPGSDEATRELALALAGLPPTCRELGTVLADLFVSETISWAESLAAVAVGSW